MHTNQQLWLSWGRGEIDDDTAQAAAEAAAARQRRRYARYVEASEAAAEAAHASRQAGAGVSARPQNASAAFSGSRRGTGPREKVFGPGRCVPLDRNVKVRVMMLGRALSRRTEKGKAYGAITAKALAVLAAILWRFHNAASGKCFPSYEAIAEAAACSRTSVYYAIRALEQVGVLSWVNRIKRVREYVPGLFGKGSAWRWRVVRTSNSYVLTDPLASKFNLRTGTIIQDSNQEKLSANCRPTVSRQRAHPRDAEQTPYRYTGLAGFGLFLDR
jgi:Helix-turn-helix domain